MAIIETINGYINDFVWGVPAIALIMGGGLYLTIRLKGVQFRDWGFLFSRTYKKAFKDAKTQEQSGEVKEGEITPFQAAMASVSAVVGSGNIAGVATALVSGGPGALFWMIIAALIGMATKFAEIAIGLKYREKSADGTYIGGPMFYAAKGLKAPWLGKIISVLFIFYSIVISAVVDTNTIADAFNSEFGINPVIIGVILAVLTAIVIFGGIKRIGEVCGLLSPFMAGAYLLCGLAIIVIHISDVPAAVALIVKAAFNPQAALGGAIGISITTAIKMGLARGIFSNEAGIGSAAVTHASAAVSHPGEQAVWGPFEVFVDTIIVCTVSGLTIVLSGLWDSGLDGAALTMQAFKEMLPGNWGQYVVLGSSVLFGFSCLITFYNYMEKGWIGLFGDKGKIFVKIIWIAFIIIGSFSTLGLVWDIADTCNGIIIIPNMIALIIMAKEVVQIKDEYWAKEMPLYEKEKAAKKAVK